MHHLDVRPSSDSLSSKTSVASFALAPILGQTPLVQVLWRSPNRWWCAVGEVADEITPNEFTRERFDDPEMTGLETFLNLVKLHEPWSISTEMLLNLNGNVKRGKHVNTHINDVLRRRGLVCTPPIENADYYGMVVVSDPRDEVVQRTDSVHVPLSSFGSPVDGLLHCARDTSIAKVMAIMIRFEISQLPVLSGNQKHVHGVVTWRSLAQNRGAGYESTAQGAMESAGHVAASGDNFLDFVDLIISQEFVLYTVPDGENGLKIGGIVTASDLVKAFDGAASTYLRLGEIESRLRVLLNRAPLPKLKEHLDQSRSNDSRLKSFRGAADMMFGEYLEALKDSEIWSLTGIELDKDYVLSVLGRVKDARNGVMHFSDLDESEDGGQPDDHVAQALRLLRAVAL